MLFYFFFLNANVSPITVLHASLDSVQTVSHWQAGFLPNGYNILGVHALMKKFNQIPFKEIICVTSELTWKSSAVQARHFKWGQAEKTEATSC